MKYLVLGGNGFIGSHVVDQLLIFGHDVTVFDIGNEKYREPLKNVKYFYGSISNLKLLSEAMKSQDIVIHSVSTTVPFSSNNDILYDIQSNLLASVEIFRLASEIGIKRMIYLSSGGAVYGNPKVIPIPENHPTNPISSYGITKLTIEKYLALFSQLTGMEYNIIRPSNPYGPRQNPYGSQGVISIFLGKVLNGETIEVWGDGKIYKDYIFIEELAKAIYTASTSELNSQIINIGSGETVSINKILDVINKTVGMDIHVSYKEMKNFDVQKVCLDISHANDILNFKHKISLEEGIQLTWDFIKSIKKIK